MSSCSKFYLAVVAILLAIVFLGVEVSKPVKMDLVTVTLMKNGLPIASKVAFGSYSLGLPNFEATISPNDTLDFQIRRETLLVRRGLWERLSGLRRNEFQEWTDTVKPR